eukprot:NODE_862_length_3619_cov_0.153977.p1 type:complete len:666 gc:universal NODE_862_length_3619_cov_0.153977:1043-3040(+)
MENQSSTTSTGSSETCIDELSLPKNCHFLLDVSIRKQHPTIDLIMIHIIKPIQGCPKSNLVALKLSDIRSCHDESSISMLFSDALELKSAGYYAQFVLPQSIKSVKEIFDISEDNGILTINEELYSRNIKDCVIKIMKPKARQRMLGTVERAFTTKYWNESNCTNFLNFINAQMKGYCSEKHLAKYTTIVNGGGVGKSRLLRELSTQVVVLYCCARKSSSSGFPEKSKLGLLDVESNLEHPLYVERFVAYFAASLETYASRIDSDEHPFDRQTSAEYQQVLSDSFQKHIKKIDAVCSPYRLSLGDYEKYGDWRQHLEVYLQRFAMNETTLFVFDEARAFLEVEVEVIHKMKVTKKPLFYFMQQALILFDDIEDIFCVMVDTLPRVSYLDQSDEINDPSRRFFYKSTGELLDPYYTIDTMDAHLHSFPLGNFSCIQKYMNNEDIGDQRSRNISWTIDCIDSSRHVFTCMLMYGRPLWMSALVGSISNDMVGKREISKLEDVRFLEQEMRRIKDRIDMKLKEVYKANKYDDFSANCAFYLGILSILLGNLLKLNDVMAEQLISDMMAFCYYISGDRNTLMCGYASEPALSYAAGMLIFGKERRLQLFHAIRYLSDTKYSSKDAIGELFGRLILVSAMHSSMKAQLEIEREEFKKTAEHNSVLYFNLD